MCVVKNLDLGTSLVVQWGFDGSSVIKNLPARQETQETRVRSLGWEDPLEEEMATHFRILGWRIPWTRGARWATVHGVAKTQA